MASPLTVWSSAEDGRITGTSTDYETARSTATVTTSVGTSYSVGQSYSDPNYNCREYFAGFDTSSIGAGQTATTATFSLYSVSDSSTTDFVIEARIRDWGGSLTDADWVAGANLGDYTLVASMDTSAWSVDAYNALTSQAAFLSNIAMTGTTYLMAHSSRMRTGDAATGNEFVNWYAADDATGGGGTDRDPKLYVEYEEASASPLTVWSTTADGVVVSYSDTYSAARNGTGTLLAVTNSASYYVGCQRLATPTYYVYESFYSFDTSTVGSESTVTVATFSLCQNTGATTEDINLKAYNWGGTITTADWTSGDPADTPSLDDYTKLASYTTTWDMTGIYVAFTSEAAFLSNIAQTGTTYVMASGARHEAGTTPTGNDYANAFYADDATGGGGTDKDPKLYVEWTEGGAVSGMKVRHEY